MATCESLEQEIKRLRSEASGLRERINKLEAAAKNNPNNNNSKTLPTKGYDDSELRTRVGKLETNQDYFTTIIKELIDDAGYVMQAVKIITECFDFVINIFTSVFNIFKG
jgi:chromosome segregation ATPase